MNLFDVQHICLNNGIPFYSFRMPQSNRVITGIQLTPDIKEFSGFDMHQQGFVVAPFNTGDTHRSLFIRGELLFENNNIPNEWVEKLQSLQFSYQKREELIFDISKEDYLHQAAQLIRKLSDCELQKVVLSRIINHQKGSFTDAPSIFNKLTDSYLHAFVSIFHIPGECTWLGATPETLLSVSGDDLFTMSLAGTKKNDPSVKWTFKEQEEQQMVSDFVEKVLCSYQELDIKTDGPKEVEAGHLCHLMTTFNCKGKLSGKELTGLVNKLHPTPAVCGLPKAKAMQLIHDTETHNREYYAGYIGPVSDGKIDLFVNLRCMKLMKESVAFYVGGGLTALSNPEAEWQETCLKAETLSKFL